MTLTFNPVSRITVSLLFERGIKFGVWVHLGMARCGVPFLVIVTLTFDLVSRIIMSEAYLLYFFLGMNPYFGVWMRHGMVKWCIPFWGHIDL